MFYVHLTIEWFAHVGIYSAVLEKNNILYNK